MNEIQVCVKYSSLFARLLLYLLLALVPIWGVFSPVYVILVLGAWALGFAKGDPFSILGGIGGLTVMTSTASLTCIALADNRLIANREGLRLPFHASIFTRLRRDFRWDEIESVTFACCSPSEFRQLSIFFKTVSGLSFNLKTERISDPELEQLLLALEVWVDSARVDERLPQIKENLQHRLSIADSQKQSYTALWEDELERHFASTAFVVLEPEAFLRAGRLRVVRQLSFGGLSAVYLCQLEKRELVVLKESVVPADSSQELRQKSEEMFAREACFLMRLKHPNIVSVLDYFAEKGRNYLLLEYVNGPDLKQYVRERGLQPEYRVIEWARKLAEVLEYLHGQDPPILHRDLSPDNIVLDQNQNLKIIDFGAANVFLGTATGTLVGKQAYLPMEQLRGKTVPQSDIYALGGTLHFLLTGSDPEPLCVSHPRERRAEVSSWLDALIARCTDADWHNRPESAAQLLELLMSEDDKP